MSMFCFQCQETARNTGCTVRGVCGKSPEAANMMDLLIYTLKGIAVVQRQGNPGGSIDPQIGLFMLQSLFKTITNANFDTADIQRQMEKAVEYRDSLKKKFNVADDGLPDCAVWTVGAPDELLAKSEAVGVMNTDDEDVRSLRELVTYGLKGLAAYVDHAAMLGFEDQQIYNFAVKALAALTDELSAGELTALTIETGQFAVQAMELLDRANTSTFGNPQMTTVNIGVGTRPGILVSGHDLRDMRELLEQTEGTGVDVYSHSEMLPAHYYPELKKFSHFVGNYGGSWWHQQAEFDSFNGPILMTTNCIVPLKDGYAGRIFTTGMTGYPGVPHIADRQPGAQKDFSAIIEMAKKCAPPKELETGSIVGGFAHAQVFALADKVVEAVKSGAIRRFVVMAGCDGRHKERDYFTKVAESLPKDTIILTAGCAKYRYNKLQLGDIGGIPRVLDAGQCNDSYSLAIIALKLKEIFGLDDVNKLPLSFDIAWYEQKAVAVLLALLALGFKNLRLGPTLPAFLSPGVAKVLVEAFDIKGITDADTDVKAMMAGN